MPEPATPTSIPPPTIPGIVDLSRVGRGGFGTVYRGRQTEFHRDVAIKVLDGVTDDPTSDTRFRREVAAMGAVSHHPNVVPVYATGVTADGHPYLVMPYLPGGTLGDRFRRQPMDWREVTTVGTKLAGALAAAHGMGVLHRDVKPSNILYSAYDEPQLADFGIARLADATRTTTGLVTATVTYAPPEILSGQPASPASDLYSLAATLHAALTGRPPFAATSGEPLAATVARVVTEDPPDLRSFGVPDAVATVIDDAMAKHPADRPPSAEVFQRELAAAGQLPAAVIEDSPPTARINTGDLAAMPPPPGVVVGPDDEDPEVLEERPEEADDPAGRRKGPLLAAVLAGLAVLTVLGLLVAGAIGGDDDPPSATAETTTAPTSPSTSAPSSTTASSTRPEATTTTPTSQAPTSATSSTTSTTSTTTTSTTTSTTAPTTTAPPPTTAPAPTGAGPGAPTIEETVTQYYALTNQDRLDEAYTWLSPDYQEQTGRSSFDRFWVGDIQSVSVSDVQPRGEDSATATLVYVRTDGSRSTERVSLEFVRDEATGNYLIDGYQSGA